MSDRGVRMPKILRHPLTGAPIVPVGYVRGKPVWPIMGGAPDDGDDHGDSGDSGSGDDHGDSASRGDGSTGDRGDSTDSGGSGDKGDGDKDVVTRADLEAMERRMQAADKRASDAEKKLKDIEDAKKDDLTKAQDRVTELEGQLEELNTTVSDLRLQNAFLSTNKFTWHDSDTALSIARSKGFLDDVVNDKGEVDNKALGSALEKLAKEQAYLVKTEKDDDKDDDGPSGSSGPGRSDNSKDKAGRKQELRRRFPALNR